MDLTGYLDENAYIPGQKSDDINASFPEQNKWWVGTVVKITPNAPRKKYKSEEIIGTQLAIKIRLAKPFEAGTVSVPADTVVNLYFPPGAKSHALMAALAKANVGKRVDEGGKLAMAWTGDTPATAGDAKLYTVVYSPPANSAIVNAVPDDLAAAMSPTPAPAAPAAPAPTTAAPAAPAAPAPAADVSLDSMLEGF